MYSTDITVAALVFHEGRYLMIEERAGGRKVLTQPGGHIEDGESAEQAVEREVLEESGCTVSCNEMIGVYLWIHPQTRQQFLKLVFEATFVLCDETLALDAGILRRIWLDRQEIEARRRVLRTPAVLRCIEDFEAGKRQTNRPLRSIPPLPQNVDKFIARADLV